MTRIGVIADDLTGATDVAIAMTQSGVRTALAVGCEGQVTSDAEAVVIALKSRSCPAELARQLSADALAVLQRWGADTVLFKICSTFDSTDAGNIGPVGDMLSDTLGAAIVPVCPAYPINRRTVYQGHLFVADQLLAESGMKDHPLNPMRDSDLRRLLARQSAHDAALADLAAVRKGPAALAQRMQSIMASGARYLIVDATEDSDIDALANAVPELPLYIGGAALGAALARCVATPGAGPAHIAVDLSSPAVILAGSCSDATRGQIAAAQTAGMPSYRLSVEAVLDGTAVDAAAAFAMVETNPRGVLIHSSAGADDRAGNLDGASHIGEQIEVAMGEIASRLARAGVTRLVVAGGETSGAVIQALGIEALMVGPEIDPGVPWMVNTAGSGMTIALKSGNFGAPDFFVRAAACQ